MYSKRAIDRAGSTIMSDSFVRKHIVVSGQVQGVGFRYRAMHAASALGLTGWVRNDPSGTVTMEIQGEEERIQRIIPMIENSSWISIESCDEKYIPVDVSESGFRVRGY